MDVAPELRASLSGANPLPGWPDEDHVPIDTKPSSHASRRHRQGTAPRSSAGTRRRVGQLARWYLTPSGLLAGAALVLLAAGLAAPGLFRLIAVAGVVLLAAFLPYRFLREQRRTDRQVASVRVDVGHQIEVVKSRSRRTDTELTQAIARVCDVEREIAAVRQTAESANEQVAALRERGDSICAQLDEIESHVKPSRRFTASRPDDPERLELTMRDATAALRSPPEPEDAPDDG
jgi:hypothetical protein